MFMLWIQLLCLLQYTACFHLFDAFRSSKCKADEKEPWTYRGNNGPQYWGERYPMCNGQEQSPIAIRTNDAVQNPQLPKLTMVNYDVPLTKATIENNGHTIQVTPADGVDRTINVNGEIYRLSQFHFHWGETASRGSEHTIDGEQYSMELHFVHQNANNEIAVVGVFFQEQKKESSELQNLINQFPKVMYKDTSTPLRSRLQLDRLLPENPASYFRYQGSLTTPDCAEGVTWSVLPKPLPVGKNQMKDFRKLYSATRSEATRKCKLSDNYRPVQPLNQRTVFVSQ